MNYMQKSSQMYELINAFQMDHTQCAYRPNCESVLVYCQIGHQAKKNRIVDSDNNTNSQPIICNEHTVITVTPGK